MSKWNEPLESHLCKDYYEFFALFVLQSLFPEEHKNTIKLDMPDLQNQQTKTGIEVVRALQGESGKTEALIAKYSHENVPYKKDTLKKQLKEMGCVFRDYPVEIINCPAELNALNFVIYEFKRKLEKLNGDGYTSFLHNDLFVHAYVYPREDTMRQAMQDMIGNQKDFETKFETVYVYEPECIHIFDLKRDKFCSMKLVSKEQESLACKARSKAECDG